MGDTLMKLFVGVCVILWLFVWACSSLIEAFPE